MKQNGQERKKVKKKTRARCTICKGLSNKLRNHMNGHCQIKNMEIQKQREEKESNFPPQPLADPNPDQEAEFTAGGL